MSTYSIEKIAVLVVDDHPPLRVGIRAILEDTPDILVVGEAGTGEEAVELLQKLHPKVILLDLKIPGFSPYRFEKWAREQYPETVTLVLTAHDRDAYLANMIDAGAVGYLSKEISDERLILAIRHAASGEMLFDENQIARANRWHEDIQKKWDYLTEREKQVLQMIADEKSEKEVATTLGICIKTVEYHMTKILEKLEVSSRRDARKWMSEYSNGDEERWK